MMQIALTLAKRGTCLKKKVGAVALDKDNRLISGAYNGAPKGWTHCDEITPCLAFSDPGISCSALHAEQNLLLHCNPKDIATVYVTEEPCHKCRMLLHNVGNIRIVYLQDGQITEDID
jgi:dCMP deaminase